MHSYQDRERGGVLVTVALTLVVLVGFTALAVDGGVAYGERRATQNAADHAALAAAWAACMGNDPQTAALDSAAANGYTVDDVVVSVSGTSATVQVTAVQNTGFGSAIGTEQITVVSEATADCEPGELPGDYALFAGAPPSCTGYELNAPNAGKQITGGVHSNGDFSSTGATGDYWGPATVTYTGTPNIDAGHTFHAGHGPGPTKPYPVFSYWVPETYDIASPNGFRAQAAQAAGRYQKTVGNRTFTAATLQANRLYYVEGNVMINSGPGLVRNNVTIVATGSIQMAGVSTMLTPYEPDGLVLFSNHPGSGDCGAVAIHGSAAGNGWLGFMYAPHGEIRLNNAGSMTLNGALIGYRINLAGATTNITKNSSFVGEREYTVQFTQ